ncbi:MAG: hypothetical protein GY859_23510, partial [Desulfobacterales bacterium]|nr:hypothetical protein [Desulfobacterales bacterium]
KTMSEQMTPGGFRQTLEKLRKSARDKLERCVSTRKSLLEFLKGKEISIDELIKENDWADLEELCDLLTPGPWEAEGFERRLHHIYFTAFFSIMRKQTGNGG